MDETDRSVDGIKNGGTILNRHGGVLLSVASDKRVNNRWLMYLQSRTAANLPEISFLYQGAA